MTAPFLYFQSLQYLYSAFYVCMFSFLATPRHTELLHQGSDLRQLKPKSQLQQCRILNPLCRAGSKLHPSTLKMLLILLLHSRSSYSLLFKNQLFAVITNFRTVTVQSTGQRTPISPSPHSPHFMGLLHCSILPSPPSQ